ncbi:hypothetical protein SRB5_10650 [Streptomyces sp. RB5]|uniref:Uncharacterized protein n=1 Tax=Streptomyces smaragdinus TaxID=2585196 RepID=A0A7K0CBX9_9ACTN|nr:hypothetical protein [Streptomyces smaragdinus]MQY10951.1 hypothetical protein [Streptomyces smaragdinus]
MSDGIAWIGEHSYEDPTGAVPGMRGNISLTAARGVEPEDFLLRLGADIEQLRCHDMYKDYRSLALNPLAMKRAWPAMYGTCGEWLYVLEDWGMATWYAGRPTVAEMEPRTGEEIICLTMNRGDPPQRILHAPGDGHVWYTEFGAETGCASALDAALNAAGAVFPSVRDAAEADVVAYFEEHMRELPPAVFAAVGAYSGLSVDRSAVEAGDLPLAILTWER